ncbi:KLTH0D08118p [Lachancea thermotolerans CBS 6340]|uniref:KLTH0D08118p n=1 Tax=Lachancea thermotolerans (strain ATCC 56472 / CBS 6340 / NRRL Y-8284) TaxID=559295 RepID=C5DGT5_LACTC|nr:KLTH0D08118p [Lachancea thermotolerans CBS 6340]CAR22627.1 KLTH0D08118p [Lachancea thermotolerans CBS 6340]
MKLTSFLNACLVIALPVRICSATALEAQDAQLRQTEILNSWNATTTKCQDRTVPLIDKALSYKFSVDSLERGVSSALSTLRASLQGKDEFCALDIVRVATEQMRWMSLSDVDFSTKISFAAQFSQVKTIYYSVPMLRQLHRCVSYAVASTADSVQWKGFIGEAAKAWYRLISNSASGRDLSQAVELVQNSSKLQKILAKARDEWVLAAPLCERHQDVHTNHINLENAASRVAAFHGPKPGDAPSLLASKDEEDNHTVQGGSVTHAGSMTHVPVNSNESSGVVLRKISSWSVMGAVVVVLSGVALF